MRTDHLSRLYMSEVLVALAHVDFNEVGKAIEILRTVRDNGRNVWIVGNGGSASTASHLANDLTKMCGLRAFSIPDMVPTVLAYGNDNGWKWMFHDPISKLYVQGDVLIAISCSGNSENVVACTEFIQEPVIVFTGNNLDCKLAKIKHDAIMYAHNKDITVQESVHSVLCHMIARVLSREV